MNARWLLVALLLSGVELQAITWEFDEEGNAQGWTTFEGINSTSLIPTIPRLPAEVRDGVWRIETTAFQKGRRPAIQLISPRIGHDAALFDRITIRFRVVHTQPLIGSVRLNWTNTANPDVPGGSPSEGDPASEPDSRFQFWTPGQVYTTEWQEFTVGDLRSGPVVQADGRSFDIWWEGELIDFRLEMVLSSELVSSPDGWPEAIEIERIVLTGVEEQWQGELPPPVEEKATVGGLFAAPEFFFLDQAELGGWGFLFSPAGSGALGDLDADGDLDLVLPWGRGGSGTAGVGWLAALNDGEGRFSKSHVEKVGFTWAPYLNGADIDHDERMDLLLMRWGDSHNMAKIRFNDSEEGWIDGPVLDEVRGLGLADANGDGYADLWLTSGISSDPREYNLVLYLNDGSRNLQDPLIISIDTDGTNYYPWRWAHHLRGGEVTGILWGVLEGSGYAVTYLDETGEVRQEPLETAISPSSVLYAGDVDQDGDVDLLASDSEIRLSGAPYERGLSLWHNQGDNTFVEEEWLPEVVLSENIQPEPVLFFDLNRDGVLDPVMVDHDERQPALVVGLGRRDGPPVVEGRYLFEGKGGTLLGGDVDGDGDTDLVLVRRESRNEGVYVLKNRWAESRTAVETEADHLEPAGFRLDANYPNPFNPQTWIPFEVPGNGGFVDLRIYNVLGQPIRTLVAGRLTPGYHLVPWDGRDNRGEAISSGVYLYHLKVDDWQASGRMTRSR